jgi:hypothetical protein
MHATWAVCEHDTDEVCWRLTAARIGAIEQRLDVIEELLQGRDERAELAFRRKAARGELARLAYRDYVHAAVDAVALRVERVESMSEENSSV